MSISATRSAITTRVYVYRFSRSQAYCRRCYEIKQEEILHYHSSFLILINQITCLLLFALSGFHCPVQNKRSAIERIVFNYLEFLQSQMKHNKHGTRNFQHRIKLFHLVRHIKLEIRNMDEK